MSKLPLLGNKTPHFQLKDIKGVIYTESDLSGKTSVLIFLPEKLDETTLHLLHTVRDNIDVFMKADSLVITISPHSIKENANLIKDHHLNFPVLNDPTGEIYKAFGLNGHTNIIESTIILDSDNYICWIERPIKHDSHLKRILKIIKDHAPKNVVIPDVFDEYDKFIKGKLKKDTPP